MKIEKEVVVTEDISKYFGDMNPEMYYDKEDLEEFVDQVLAEVVEATGKEDLRLFNIYLSDGDKLKIVLEDRNEVYPVEVKVDPRTSRIRRGGIFKYVDDAVNGLVAVINEYRDLFETKSRVSESAPSVDFEDWSSRIIFNEYQTLAKLRKFSNEHPEYRKDMLSLKDQIGDIFSQARFESIHEAHHYGGAFDIRDDEYFTRDDLNELMDYVETELNQNLVGDKLSISDADITDQVLNLEMTSDKDGFLEEYHKKIDMRKIKIPRDLIKVYGADAVREFKEKFESDGVEFSIKEVISESLTDVVQTAPYVIVPVGMYGSYKYVTPEGEVIVTTDVSEAGAVNVSGIEDKKDYFKDTYTAMREFESDLGKYLESEDKE